LQYQWLAAATEVSLPVQNVYNDTQEIRQTTTNMTKTPFVQLQLHVAKYIVQLDAKTITQNKI